MNQNLAVAGKKQGYKMNLIIETMQYNDFEAVRSIYEFGIATGNATFETKCSEWQEWNEKFLKICRFVIKDGNTLVGWAALTPYSKRDVYRGVAEVSIYIHPDYRKKGVGNILLQHLINKSENVGFWTLQAGIFPENTGSLRLHEKYGFRRIGTREKIGQMNGKWRDVVLLERRSRKIGV